MKNLIEKKKQIVFFLLLVLRYFANDYKVNQCKVQLEGLVEGQLQAELVLVGHVQQNRDDLILQLHLSN